MINKNTIFYIILFLCSIIVFWDLLNIYWTIIISTLWILFWLYTLIFAWDKLVSWASSLANNYKIPPIVIWLTIVSFGTSAPELVVSMMSALSGKADLSIANVVWSNLVNLLLILWVSAIIYPITVNKNSKKYEIPFSLLITIIFLILVNDVFLWIWDKNILSNLNWIILLCIFAWFMYYIFKLAKSWEKKLDEEEWIEKHPNYINLIYIIIWIFWLYIWGNLTVNWSIFIAKSFWVSELLIWATIVAVWTSLPELVASVIAARKKHSDIAIWNVIWSNIFNILWILWFTSVITDINFNSKMNLDIILLIFVTILLSVFIFLSKNSKIWKLFWFSFIWIYIMYTIFIIYRW